MISVKDFAITIASAVWPYASDAVTSMIILQQLSSVEMHTKFWAATLIALIGPVFGWRYLTSKTERERAETRKQQAEARRIEIENEEKLLQNEIERKHYESVVRKMATEELIEQLAENVKKMDSDMGISEQLKRHGIHIDKFEKDQ